MQTVWYDAYLDDALWYEACKCVLYSNYDDTCSMMIMHDDEHSMILMHCYEKYDHIQWFVSSKVYNGL